MAHSQIERVNHPKHYNMHPSGVECIDIARHYCFSIGNAIKYLWRAGLKREWDMTGREKEIEDLRKAVWYIEDRIKELQGDGNEAVPNETKTKADTAGKPAVEEYHWDDGEIGRVL